MPKISLKSIGQQIRGIQRQLRSSRSRIAPEQRTDVDDLIAKLDGLHAQAAAACPKAMDGLAVKAARVARPKARKASGSKRRTR
jgi:hypothetical protein